MKQHPYHALDDKEQLRSLLCGKDDAITSLRLKMECAKGQISSLEEQVSSLKEQFDECSNFLLNLLQQEQKRAEAAEKQAETLHVSLSSINACYRIFRESNDLLSEEINDLLREVEAARQIIMAAPIEFRPTQFWETFYAVNLAQLKCSGIANFKLSINQNYQNFIPLSWDDAKLQPLVEFFLQQPALDDLIGMIECPSHLALAPIFPPGSPPLLADDRALAMYRAIVVLGWRKAKSLDRYGLCDALEEPELGNPIRVTIGGRLISQDLATSIGEINCFLPYLDQGNQAIDVLEIGGGYGRLAHALMRAHPVRRYIIVDIPPAQQISARYLSKLHPNLQVFSPREFESWNAIAEEIEKCNIVCLFPHQLSKVPNCFVDLTLAISSLHEMQLRQANTYIREMARVSRHVIYSKQYWRYINPYDDIVINQYDYETPHGYREAHLATDPLNPAFFEQVLLRNDSK